jgi:hypothetical protein
MVTFCWEVEKLPPMINNPETTENLRFTYFESKMEREPRKLPDGQSRCHVGVRCWIINVLGISIAKR